MSLLAIIQGWNVPKNPVVGLPAVQITHDDPETFPMVIDNDYTGQLTAENARGSQAFSLYDGNIEFGIGGNYTATLPKKPINLKLKNSGGSTIASGVLDLMPASEEFRLLANHDDPLTGIRNWIMFQMGIGSVVFTPQVVFVEMWEETEFQGLYLLAQRVKRGSALPKSVLVAMPGGGTPDQGGMSWEIANDIEVDDAFITTGEGVNLKWNYPSKANVTPAHATYGAQLFSDLEAAFAADDLSMIDVPSWANMHVIHALMLNKDAFQGSTYYYKPVGGKITACCMWDGTLSLANPLPDIASETSLQDPEYNPFMNEANQGWNASLMGIPAYRSAFKSAFNNLRPKYIHTLKEARRVYELLKYYGAYERNASVWDFFGTDLSESYMDEQIVNLEEFAIARLDYMQTQVDLI